MMRQDDVRMEKRQRLTGRGGKRERQKGKGAHGEDDDMTT